jgi:hypothetical protein
MSSVSLNKTINSVVNNQNFKQLVNESSKDGRINLDEANQLKSFVNDTKLPEKEKLKLNNIIDTLSNATTGIEEKGSFIFKSTQEVTKNLSNNDIESLKQLSGKSKIANVLLKSVTESQNTINSTDSVSVQTRSSATSKATPSVSLFDDKFDESPMEKTVSANSSASPKADSAQPHKFNYAESKGKILNTENIGQFHVNQFSGLPSENGDCGPSSAAMILKANGFDVDVTTIRKTVGVTKPRGGAWALSENEIKKAVEKLSNGTVKEVARKGFNSKNQDNMIAYIRAELSKGNIPMLETGAVNVNSRHYTVVLGVKDDGTIQGMKDDGQVIEVADPSNPFGISDYSEDMLPAMMAKADKRGGSHVISFRKME